MQRKWLQFAEEALTNKLHKIVFSVAVTELLINGRGKNSNILTTGATLWKNIST